NFPISVVIFCVATVMPPAMSCVAVEKSDEARLVLSDSPATSGARFAADSAALSVALDQACSAIVPTAITAPTPVAIIAALIPAAAKNPLVPAALKATDIVSKALIIPVAA